jgi:Ca-activated chloride channel family protein
VRFAEPVAFLFLILVPLAVVLHVFLEKARIKKEQAAGDLDLLRALVLSDTDKGKGLRVAQLIVFSAAIGLVALSLARPQFGMRLESRKARGIDLVVALDLSKSMLARDVVPSRLERAKLELNQLVDQLKGDRVGLVGFTSIALPLCPLTVDHAAFKLQLKSATPGDLPRGGTAITDAIEAAQKMLETSKQKSAAKAVLIITDGEDNEGDASAAAKKAHDAGMEVHVVGVGSRTGEPIPVLKDNGQIEGYLKDKSGQTVVSRLNETVLRQIADQGGGLVALPGDVGGIDLSPVRTHLESLKKAELEERAIRIYEERFQWALLPALVLLLVATFLRPIRKRARMIVRGLAKAAIVLLLLAPRAEAEPLKREDPDTKKGNANLADGHAKEAVDDYGRAIARLGEDPRVVFDRGLAESKQGELDKATADLRMSMENGDTPELRGESAFALGNAYRKLKKWDDAITAYRRGLVEDPKLSGARRNLEIARREKVIQELQPKDPNKKNESDDKKPPESKDAGQEDSGPKDSGQGDGSGSEDGGGGQDTGGQNGPDGGTGDSSSQNQNQSQDGGGMSDGGSQEQQPSEEKKAEPPKDADKEHAAQLLDALQEQEKALKRKKLLEKYRGKSVEKDW